MQVLPEKFGPETDLMRTVAFLNNFNIVWKYTPASSSSVATECPDSITVEAKNCDATEGYTGFETTFTFDETGKFLKMGIWE